jgi:hypothetical protein
MTMEDVTRDAIEAAGREHVLSVALDERIRLRVRARSWYRTNARWLRLGSLASEWGEDEHTNRAALRELLALRSMVKRATR